MEGVQELGVRVAVDVDDHVAILFVAVDDVHEEERLALGLLLHLLPRLSVHQVDLDLSRARTWTLIIAVTNLHCHKFNQRGFLSHWLSFASSRTRVQEVRFCLVFMKYMWSRKCITLYNITSNFQFLFTGSQASQRPNTKK